MKRWGCVVLLGVWVCLGCGCGRKKVGIPVVCEISVSDAQQEQVYREPEKMQMILNRLRSLGQCYRPEADPELLRGDHLTITLLRSDGKCQQYQLKSDRYIRFGQGPWQQTDPGPLSELRELLQTMEGNSSAMEGNSSALLHFQVH